MTHLEDACDDEEVRYDRSERNSVATTAVERVDGLVPLPVSVARGVKWQAEMRFTKTQRDGAMAYQDEPADVSSDFAEACGPTRSQ